LTLLLIAAPFALYLLHRVGTTRGFSGIAAAEAVGSAIVGLLAIWLTYVGFGSIALWAFRFAWVQLGALGTLMSRALPLLMITVVVFFTGELWQLAAVGSGQTARGHPLATKPGHQPVRTPLSLAEQVNVVAVMVVSQAIQVVFFTAGLFAFFLALGIVAVPDDVAVLWSAEETCPVGEPPCPGTWFGVHVPVPQTIVHVSLFVAVLSGLYFTVSTSVDPIYRERFFDPQA
jgi:hypothetical protein